MTILIFIGRGLTGDGLAIEENESTKIFKDIKAFKAEIQAELAKKAGDEHEGEAAAAQQKDRLHIIILCHGLPVGLCLMGVDGTHTKAEAIEYLLAKEDEQEVDREDPQPETNKQVTFDFFACHVGTNLLQTKKDDKQPNQEQEKEILELLSKYREEKGLELSLVFHGGKSLGFTFLEERQISSLVSLTQEERSYERAQSHLALQGIATQKHLRSRGSQEEVVEGLKINPVLKPDKILEILQRGDSSSIIDDLNQGFIDLAKSNIKKLQEFYGVGFEDDFVKRNLKIPDLINLYFLRKCHHGRLETVRFYLTDQAFPVLQKLGLDINYKEYYCATPLFAAAQEGYVKIVELLLEKEGN